MLVRELSSRVPWVTGIDRDAPSIGLARRHADRHHMGQHHIGQHHIDQHHIGQHHIGQGPVGEIDFICGDVLDYPFQAGSFGMVTSVAALHHMDAEAALGRLSQILAPGGTLAVIGLARSRLPADLPWEAAAAAANLPYRLTRTHWQHSSPMVWPPPHTYAEIRRLAQEVLPGARYRRHLLWRYSLLWTKPG